MAAAVTPSRKLARGLGLFAKHKILIDTKIGYYDGQEVAHGQTMAEASRKAMYSQSLCLLAVKRHGGWCVVDGETKMKYINDPRGTAFEANAVFESDGCVVAIASIQLDEEILVDYGDNYFWTRR